MKNTQCNCDCHNGIRLLENEHKELLIPIVPCTQCYFNHNNSEGK